MDFWDTIADDACRESMLWQAALRPGPAREHVAGFSTLCDERFALGLETIYEGYLCHYGRPRLFAPADAELALLLGDYLYAHGLVRIAEAGGVDAVAVMADLISTCAALRASGGSGDDGEAWVEAATLLGGEPGRDEIDRALARHYVRVGP